MMSPFSHPHQEKLPSESPALLGLSESNISVGNDVQTLP